MKRAIVLSALLLAGLVGLSADEGMFPLFELHRLDADRLQAMGLQVPLADVAGRLAPAVVSLGGGTGSFVSAEGLIITNHHVAYGAIQYNSTGERNLIRDGFYAPTRAEELPAPNMTATIILEAEDVTDRVLAGLAPGLTGLARHRAIEATIKQLTAEAEATGEVQASVAAMYQGRQYIRFKTLRLRDIRLVQAPPEAIGEFGGDIDNFEWPRHTGDYAFLRAYVGPDGKPANFDPANQPYRPQAHLAISGHDLAEDDFAMVMGFPGSTNRYLTGRQVAHLLHQSLPLRIGVFRDIIDMLERVGAQTPEYQVRLASQVKGLNNSMKKWTGDQEGLTRDAVVDRFSRRDVEIGQWLEGQPDLADYRSVIAEIDALADRQAVRASADTLVSYFGRLVTTLGAGQTIARWATEKAKPDMEREPAYMERNVPRLRQQMQVMQRNLLVEKDKIVAAYLVGKLLELPVETQPGPIRDRFAGLAGAERDQAVHALFDGTGLTDPDTRLRYLDLEAEALAALDDPLLRFARELVEEDRRQEDTQRELAGELRRLQPRMIDLLHRFDGRLLYPDANSTMRLTYGRVRGYAKDGVVFTPFTTLAGLVAKERGRVPFANPPELIELYRQGDFGPYASAYLGGQVPVNFLTDLDTTGGNSGSPALNGRGEVIGLLFDGNFESISSDYFYNPDLTRSIIVDSRFILFTLDRFSGAQALLDELTVVR